jgi:hypothetical protein
VTCIGTGICFDPFGDAPTIALYSAVSVWDEIWGRAPPENPWCEGDVERQPVFGVTATAARELNANRRYEAEDGTFVGSTCEEWAGMERGWSHDWHYETNLPHLPAEDCKDEAGRWWGMTLPACPA